MSGRSIVFAALVLGWAGTGVAAQAPAGGGARKEPLFRLDAGGPTSVVTCLAFSPDGKTLYAGGYDKVVRTWHLQVNGTFQIQTLAYRVPIGPGIDGAINAIALSPDGKWLAVAGDMLMRARAEQVRGRRGLVFPVAGLSDDNWEDRGTIYVFDTRTGAVRPLRGHRGPVLGLAFAPALKGQPPRLVSAARERDTTRDRYVGDVRVWDVDAGKVQDEWVALATDPGATRPGLAVSRLRAAPEELRVALAWKDGKLRVRAPERKQVWEVADGGWDDTAAPLPDQDVFLTTSFRGNSGGHLQEWAVAADRAPAPRGQLAFPTRAGTLHLPLALTLCSRRAGGPLDLAALVVRDETREHQFKYLLRLVDLSGPIRTSGDVDLGWEEPDLAVLAAAPGGQYLAVAGNPDDHRIAVYSLPALLNRPAPVQALRSQGAPVRYAAFVKKGKAAGLLLYGARAEVPLRAPRDPWTGGLVYDFTTRTLTAPAGDDHAGWKIDEPAADGWARPALRFEGQGASRHAVAVLERGGAAQGRVELRPGDRVDALALLPPRAPFGVPLLAVAWRDPQGLPMLALYNGATGEQVRQLAGHTGIIRSLAFAGDGRLLVSAAEDQTVCLWSLSDVPRILGKNGTLPGLAVRLDRQRNALVVARVDSGPLTAAGLAAGDAVEGLTAAGGQVQHPASPLAFFEALWVLKPKTQVTLAVRTAAGQAKQVVLAVGQGVDERKPLLFLFVTRAGNVQQREWLGWNPAGPYDSSSRRTERLLGWQFNPTNPAQPAAAGGAFASADQYRKEYRRQGILRDLVVAGTLSDALKDWEREQPPPPPPTMGLWIDEAGPDPKLDAGRVLLRNPRAIIDLSINDFPLDRIDEVTWQVDDAAPVRFEPGPGLTWSADLANRPLTRGTHTIRVLLQTQEANPKQYPQELLVRYQPPAPEVTLKAPAPAEVKVPQFRVRATVKPAEGVKVTLVQRHGGKTVLEKEVGPDVDEPVVLQPGDNELSVTAENRGALAGHEEDERGRLDFTVRLTPEKEKIAPPRIVLETGTSRGAEAEPLVVHTPRFRLRGKITASQPLTSATLDAGNGNKPLAGFQAGKAKELDLDETLQLDPAQPRTFRVAARTADSDERQAAVTIDYRPLPPRIVDLTAVDANRYEGRDPRVGRVVGRLEPPAAGNAVPYTARILVNGQVVPGQPVIDPQKRTVEAQVPLPAHNNSVAIELRTARGDTTLSEPPVLIRYLSPPRELNLVKPKVGEEAVVNLEGSVESELPLTGVEATIKADGDTAAQELTQAEKAAAGGRSWKVRLKEVPLKAGTNTVRLWASNADGRSLVPVVLPILFTPPARPAAPPSVEIVDPRQDTPVTTPEVTVRFRVASAGPLQALKVVRDHPKEVKPYPVDLTKIKRDPQGYFEAEMTVQLLSGPNTLVVSAINAGGEGVAKVVVSRTEEPVRVVIDAVTPAVPGGQPVKPVRLPNGLLRFPAQEVGKVRISGHVVWDRDDVPAGPGRLPPQVHVYVNGFQQAPADLDPPEEGSKERTFSVTALLNRRGENFLGVEVPDLKQEGSRRREFNLVCTQPVREKRLHLLIVGAGNQDPDELRARVLKALGAEALGENRFRKDGYTEGFLYATLTGPRATPSRVYTQLLVIKRAIDRRNRPDPASDVVLVYYQGFEDDRTGKTGLGGHFLVTRLTGADEDLTPYRLEMDTLKAHLDATLGAEVMLMDVVRLHDGTVTGKSKGERRSDLIAGWGDDDHVGVFRYSWRGTFDRPAAAGLLANLDDVMARAVTLEDLRSLAQATRQYPNYLSLDYYLPTHLADFVVNPPRSNGGR